MKKQIENLIDIDFVRKEIVKRPRDMHKGDAGKVLVVAGSKGMAGAAALSAKAALRTGSGLVQVAVTEDILNTVQCIAPEATCLLRYSEKARKSAGMAPTRIKSFAGEAIDINEFDAIAFGPGLGTGEEEKDLLLRVLSEYEGPLVIDADGLNIIARYDLTQEVRETKARVIITPHVGEAKRLLGAGKEGSYQEKDADNREEMVFALAEKYDCIAILKGNMTLIAEGEKVYINATGNPGMATGGSGDVLTGIIASLAGQGIESLDAAKLGVFVHGMAGDEMASFLGEYGLISSDLLTGIAIAIKNIVEGCEKEE